MGSLPLECQSIKKIIDAACYSSDEMGQGRSDGDWPGDLALTLDLRGRLSDALGATLVSVGICA